MGSGTHRSTISKVGHRWIYVRTSKCRFDRASGREDTQYGLPAVLYTVAGYEKAHREVVVRKALTDAGITLDRSVPNEKMLAIHAALVTAGLLPEIPHGK